ncbi:hypothetical protein J132_03441 [Termitomyces sp. J132]|nr:hypothetical protein J132_03441 [Termitomyces sp. J132]
MKYCGSTSSGYKLILCTLTFKILKHICMPSSCIPVESHLALLKCWGPCKLLSVIQAFLGTVGVLKIFLKNFAHHANNLMKLTHVGILFEFGPDQINAQPLFPFIMRFPNPVILVVDMSYIAIGYYLCQCARNNHKECCYNHFGSITLNNREFRFSQPKLELYGDKTHIVSNLIIELDTHYIKGMLQDPDIQPSASMNNWIMAILMFHFELVHVKGTFHGPDGLLQHLLQPSDPTPDDSNNSVYEDWIDRLHGFIHQVQLPLPLVYSALPLLPLLHKFQPHQPLATLVNNDSSDQQHPYAHSLKHFDVCQALFKAVDSDQSRWSAATYSVFWLEHITVCKQMGCSSYYAMTSTHSLLLADIVKATYLQPLPNSFLSSTNLIALHNVLSAHCLATICFEAEHAAMICKYNFQTGNLILMRNTRIEVTDNKKMRSCYLVPLVVISCNHGSTYILCELDGSVLHCLVAAFCLVLCFTREHISVPSNAFDINTSCL